VGKTLNELAAALGLPALEATVRDGGTGRRER